MKKAGNGKRARLRKILAILLAVLMVLSLGYSLVTLVALGEGRNAQACPEKNSYTINCAADIDAQALYVGETIRFVNTTERSLDAVWLCVYANTLRRQEAVPIEESEWDDVFPAGYAPGGVDFFSVTVDGTAAVWSMSGAYEQFMRVECALAPGQTAEIGLDYTLLLSWNGWAIGAGETGWRLNGFYPICAPYDVYAEDFVLSSWSLCIDPMLFDASDYDVTLNLPEACAVSATGRRDGSAATSDGMIAHHFTAESARDFAVVIYRGLTAADGVTDAGMPVTAWADTKAHARALLDEALFAMGEYESWFGPCGREELTLVVTDDVRDGLSRTGLVQVPVSLLKRGREDDLRTAVDRLCAGQYFGVAVGSDADREPWLRDSLCAYVSLLLAEDRGGYSVYLGALNALVLESLRITIPGGLKPDSAATRFDSLSEYEIIVVDRGAAVLHETRALMGRDDFLAGLGIYVSRMNGGIASVQDLVAAFNEATGSRWDEYIAGEMNDISSYVNQRPEWFE